MLSLSRNHAYMIFFELKPPPCSDSLGGGFLSDLN
nr:MAG TPA: hypothetical protein [Caudoviricetes sp.]